MANDETNQATNFPQSSPGQVEGDDAVSDGTELAEEQHPERSPK
jgi:hypothetical protein